MRGLTWLDVTWLATLSEEWSLGSCIKCLEESVFRCFCIELWYQSPNKHTPSSFVPCCRSKPSTHPRLSCEFSFICCRRQGRISVFVGSPCFDSPHDTCLDPGPDRVYPSHGKAPSPQMIPESGLPMRPLRQTQPLQPKRASTRYRVCPTASHPSKLDHVTPSGTTNNGSRVTGGTFDIAGFDRRYVA